MPVEADNAREEAKEIVEKCFKCGFCKKVCPVLRVLRGEQNSPRGRVLMIENDVFDSIVYNCTLCKACETLCPADIKLCDAFIKVRKALVADKKEFQENKDLVRNVDRTGNIFGEIY